MSMDINGIKSPYATAVSAAQSATGQTTAVSGTQDTGAAVSVDVSQPGQLWSQLQDLALNDPDQFKKATAQIASKLKDAASSTNGQQADVLNRMAERFDQASQSGSMKDLAPPSPQAHAQRGEHRGHHVHAAGGSGSSSGAGQNGFDSAFKTAQDIITDTLDSPSTT